MCFRESIRWDFVLILLSRGKLLMLLKCHILELHNTSWKTEVRYICWYYKVLCQLSIWLAFHFDSDWRGETGHGNLWFWLANKSKTQECLLIKSTNQVRVRAGISWKFRDIQFEELPLCNVHFSKTAVLGVLDKYLKVISFLLYWMSKETMLNEA